MAPKEPEEAVDDTPLITKPPPYADLGKDARGIFENGFLSGVIKLNMKIKKLLGIECSAGGVSKLDSETTTATANIEAKYKVTDYGLVFAEKWTTDNTLGTDVSVEDQGLKGLKIGGNFTFSPVSGDKNWLAKFGFGGENVNLTGQSKTNADGTVVQAAAVLGLEGGLAGYQAAYDTQTEMLTNSFALGYTNASFILHASMMSKNQAEVQEVWGKEFLISFFHKVRPWCATGVQMTYSTEDSEATFGVGAKYDLEGGASIRAKINSRADVGFSYQNRLCDCVTLTLSAIIETQKIQEERYKFGLAVELEA